MWINKPVRKQTTLLCMHVCKLVYWYTPIVYCGIDSSEDEQSGSSIGILGHLSRSAIMYIFVKLCRNLVNIQFFLPKKLWNLFICFMSSIPKCVLHIAWSSVTIFQKTQNTMNLIVYCAVEPGGICLLLSIRRNFKKIIKCMPNQNLLCARMAVAIASDWCWDTEGQRQETMEI